MTLRTRLGLLAIVVSAVVMGLLASLGLVGAGERGVTRWRTVITPADSGLSYYETIDAHFGRRHRHGIERSIRNNFGIPVDVDANSPDMTSDVAVSDLGEFTKIQVGGPDRSTAGEHRYQIDYVLPEPSLSADGDRMLIDIVSEYSYPIENIEAYLTGFQLADVRCHLGTGESIDSDRCTVEEVSSGLHRISAIDLKPNDSFAVEATVIGIVTPDPLPSLPNLDRGSNHALLFGIASTVAGLLCGFAVFFRARYCGLNEVAGMSPSDAAYGRFGPPPSPTRLVTDVELEKMATIDFVPPPDIEPWEGAVLLREMVDQKVFSGYLSTLAARGAISFRKVGNDVEIRRGPQWGDLERRDYLLMQPIFEIADPYLAGKYNDRFARQGHKIIRDLQKRVRLRKWWSGGHLAPEGGRYNRRLLLGVLGVIWIVSMFLMIPALKTLIGNWLATTVYNWWATTIFASVVVVFIVSNLAFLRLRCSRSAVGSAAYLRVESFRRFLLASEARHVDWAWKRGLLREYSAWAVALGVADVWSDAVETLEEPSDWAVTASLVASASRSIWSSLTSSSSGPDDSSGGRSW